MTSSFVLLGLAPLLTAAEPPKVRTFQFTYAGSVVGLNPGQTAHVWLPVPSSNNEQDVALVAQQTPSVAHRQGGAVRQPRALF